MSGFNWDKDYSLEELLQSVVAIKELPNKLARVINGLQIEDFAKTYRPNSWNIRQLIQHISESHMLGYIHTKQIIHSTDYQIPIYNPDEWTNGLDKDFNHEASYMIILGLHQRWSLLMLECLKQPDVYLAKSAYHLKHQKMVSLAQLIALYAWHGEHHLEQIIRAVEQNEGQ